MTALFFGKSKFRLGALLISEMAMRNLTLSDFSKGIARHTSCDWGEADAARRKLNRIALKIGGSVRSDYTATNGRKFQIITDWNRSITSIESNDDSIDLPGCGD
jgi:hypothetical protein